MGAVPPVEATPSTPSSPPVENQGACVVSEDTNTVDNMRQTPTFVHKIRDEQHRQALDDLRPRFAPIAAKETSPSAIAPVLAGVIRDAKTSRSSIVPDAAELAIVDRGRVVLPDSIANANWAAGNAVAFSIQTNHIAGTACVTGDESGTIIDMKSRVLLPLAARKRMNIADGEKVLVVAFSSPAPHLLFIPLAHAINTLLSEENS